MYPLVRQNHEFARHLLAYGASQAAGKASRLLVVLSVARTMEPAAIGVAAAAMASSDMLKSLTENGAAQRIIRAREEDLEGTCLTARRLFRLWCGGLFLVQIAVSGGVWLLTGEGEVAALIALLAIEYVFMPDGIVNCALAMREGKMTATAAISGGQIVGANIATAALALVWPSPFAIVLPKVLSAPVWLIGMRRIRPWRPDPGATPAPAKSFLRYGGAVLGVEIVKAARLQGDKLVIGAALGTEALGVWFFAMNAGLGIASSFTNAFAVALFPHICKAADGAAALRRPLALSLVLMTPVVALQAFFAPWYVPLLFGAKWAGMADLVSILCLGAIPALIWTAAAQWLRARDRAGPEFRLSAAMATATMATLWVAAPMGLEAAAWGMLAAAVTLQLGAALIALRPSPPLPQPEV